jgi:hypothetical protein
MPMSHSFVWVGGNGNWTDPADWYPYGVPGASDIATIGNGVDTPTVTVPNDSTPLPSPSNPDGLEVGAVSILSGATLALAPGMNVGVGYYNLPSGYAPSTNTFSIEGIAKSSNAGTIQMGDGTALRITGQFDNTGTITLNASSAATASDYADLTDLVIVGQSSDGVSGGVNLTGRGAIALSDSLDNEINGTVLQPLAQDILVSDNTIEGAGYITHLTLTNNGIIDGSYANNFLALGDDVITNHGTLESTTSVPGDGLAIYNGTTIDNHGGEIVAAPGSQVWIGNATVNGGTLGGQFYVYLSDTTLEGDSGGPLTIAAGGNIWVTDGVSLTLSGQIKNEGTIYLASVGDPTDLLISNRVTLSGSGQVLLSDYTANAIIDDGSAATLVNRNNTIEGAGSIGNGDGNLTLVNRADGIIDANATNPLTIDTGNTVLNYGTMEATGGGSLVIDDPVSNFGDSLLANGGNLTAENSVTGGIADVNNAILAFDSTVQRTSVNFTGSNGTLKLTDATAFSGTVAGLGNGTGNAIDLADVPYEAGVTTYSFKENKAGTQGTLTVSDGSNGPTVSLTLLGQYIASDFVIGPDSPGSVAAAVTADATGSSTPGTLITYNNTASSSVHAS